MLFTFDLPTSLKHALLRHVYEVSGGNVEGVRDAWASKLRDVLDCVGMRYWEYDYAYGDCFKMCRNDLVFCIYVTGHYETCDKFEITIYREGCSHDEIGTINVKSFDEALRVAGCEYDW